MPPEDTQVLEFGLESERYCIDIAHVSEIVGRDEITSLPGGAEHVLGAMDYRGDTLTVLDPKHPFGVEGEPSGDRIVVFDPELGDDERFALVVDSVHEVSDADPSVVDDSVENESEGVHGALRHDDRVVIWIDPRTVFE